MKYKLYMRHKLIVSDRDQWHWARAKDFEYIKSYINFSLGGEWVIEFKFGSQSNATVIYFKKYKENKFINIISGNLNIKCYNFKDLSTNVERICDLQTFN